MTDDELRRSASREGDPLAGLLSAARRDLPDSQRMAAMTTTLLQRIGPNGGGAGGNTTSGGGSAGSGAGALGSGIGAKAGIVVVAALVVAGGILQATRKTPAPAPRPVAAAPALALPSAKAAPRSEPSEAIPTVGLDDLPKLPDAAGGGKLLSHGSAPKKPTGNALADLQRAQDALASNPARALQLISEHRRDFPRSAYAQERDVLEIDALIRLGRRSDAVAKADQFARIYPKSGHNRRIDSLLGR